MRVLLFAFLWMCAAVAHASDAASRGCIDAAASMHRVSPVMLGAIVKVESKFNPHATNLNTNGTVDLGIAGINSVHFDSLRNVGVYPEDLLDPCKSIYVAAWMVSKMLYKYGNTWYGYAAYHSKTPSYNHRYQILLANELVRSGVVAGQIYPVPPLPVKPPASARR